MERVPARVNQQGKENMNGHREDRKLEAELRRRESEVAHLERRLKSSKENARALAQESEQEKRKLEQQVDSLRSELAKKDGHILALQHSASSKQRRADGDGQQDAADLALQLEQCEKEVRQLRAQERELKAELDSKAQELSDKEEELRTARVKGERAGEKMVQKMAKQTEQHLKTIASQARQINQLEVDLARTSSKRGSANASREQSREQSGDRKSVV